MNKPNTASRHIQLFTASVVLVAISACSDSDLEEFHEQEFNDAIAELELEVQTPASALPAMIDLDDYQLVFADEFVGATIDDSKWSTALWEPGTILYDQQQFYVDTQDSEQALPSPFLIEDGVLTITATRTQESDLSDASEQPWVSGLITTREDFDFTHGYIEASVNVEEGLGVWPSLWMLGAQLDQLQPQVYIFEYNGSDPDYVAHNYNYTDAQGDVRSPGQQRVQTTGFSSGFHTIALQWTADEMVYFIDGQPTYRIIGDNVPSEDMYLILNLAMGGNWVGATDATTPDPVEFNVDYVRVYQLLE